MKKVQDLIQVGIDEGAKLACGGVGKPNGIKNGFYVKPTVFTNVKNSMKIAQDEIFGPVICLIPYKNIEEAINIANDTSYGLSSMVSCGDLKKDNRLQSKLELVRLL